MTSASTGDGGTGVDGDGTNPAAKAGEISDNESTFGGSGTVTQGTTFVTTLDRNEGRDFDDEAVSVSCFLR